MNDLAKHNEDNKLEDRMNRGGDIEKLTRLIGGMTEPFTLCINASWGAGKTTFVKLWKKTLEKQGINSIYFSAWEEDFTREPLIALLGEIQGCVDRHLKEKAKREGQALLEKASKLIYHGARIAMKGYIKKQIGDGFDELVDIALERQTTTEAIKQYQQDKQIVEQFKNILAQVVAGLAGNKPFVIFIDELDRCRPLYAIEFLERVKHLFGVKGLIFVLSIDKEQLGESIKSQYGNIDTERYFMRFFDLTFELRNSSLRGFCVELYKKLAGFKIMDFQHVNFSLVEILVGDNPREIEQCFKRIELVVRMDKDYQESDDPYYPCIPLRFAIILVFLMLKYPRLQLSGEEAEEWLEDFRSRAMQIRSKNPLTDRDPILLFPRYVVSVLTGDNEGQKALSSVTNEDLSVYLRIFNRVKNDVLFVAELGRG